MLYNFDACSFIVWLKKQYVRRCFYRPSIAGTQYSYVYSLYACHHSCFESLLERNNSVSLHHRNLQLLLVEIFKTKENLNPSFMKDIFVERTENYNLRSGNTLQLPKARTTTYGKKSENLAVFKRKLRSWKGLDYNCRLCCKIYIADLGYL